ncbi:ArsR family transcriptional regulator, partial [Candidatus Dependentiae bacterium]|nr:ArsR family transcriptional regulator [Candidatus Dependentiae bacterium]
DEFTLQLQQAGLPGVDAHDWSTIFWHLAKFTAKGRVLIVFDEISWMGGKDPNFLGKLKTSWDMYLSKNSQLIIVLCGSISSWIEENILSSTGFVGRIALDLILEELPLNVCNAFWSPKEKKIAAYEKFKVLSVTGGIPFYLERIKPELPAEQNIRELCFTQGGLLVREFDSIFSDLFSRKNANHKDIVLSLASGPKTLSQICEVLKKEPSGGVSAHLDDLMKASFIQRDFTWHLEDGKESKLSNYRLSDNYVRFYLKYIAPMRSKIEKNDLAQKALSSLSAWETLMGLQFENLVIHNRKILWKVLELSPEEIVMDGPFFQNQTARQQGCQIDYLLQTKFRTLYLCEIKFSKNIVGKNIIKEMEEKRHRLKVPKYYSIRPVLIHVNGVDEQVVEAEYFDKIIDFSQLLEG